MKINFLRTKLLPGKSVLYVEGTFLQHRHDERWWKHFQTINYRQSFYLPVTDFINL